MKTEGIARSLQMTGGMPSFNGAPGGIHFEQLNDCIDVVTGRPDQVGGCFSEITYN